MPAKESARRTLDLMRFRDMSLLFDASRRNKESASHANESTLCQCKLLTARSSVRVLFGEGSARPADVMEIDQSGVGWRWARAKGSAPLRSASGDENDLS